MAAPFFAGPPPPLGAPQPEFWIEAKAPDGKPYFYHAVTRQTAWTLPAGAQLMKPPGQQPDPAQQQQGTPVSHVGGGPPSGLLGAGGAAQNALAQAQAAQQYSQSQPVGASVNQGNMPSLSMSQQPPGMMQNPGMAPMPGMMGGVLPNPGMFGMHPGMGFPQFSPFGPPPGMMPAMQQRGDPADWNEYQNSNGASYWYNSKLGKTVNEKPAELVEYEQRRKNEAAVAAAQAKPVESKPGNGEPKKEASTKPIATKQIPGTPWCVVWTSDKKSFFHNPSTKASVWKRPPELLGSKEVDELIAQVPEDAAVDGGEKRAATTNGEASSGKREASVDTQTPTKRLRGGSVDDASRDSMDSASTSSEAGVASNVVSSSSNSKAPSQRPVVKPKIDPAMEAELKAAKDREQIPLNERIAKFKELLDEKDVSAYSTWEKELHKIVFDSRYLLLTSKDRKDVFDEFTKEKAEREKVEKRKKAEALREAFRTLLAEANLTVKTSFNDFSSKFGKDDRYRNIERMRDREDVFDEFMHDVRKKEKEQRRLDQEKIRLNFIEMVQEYSGLNRKSHWSDVKKKFRDDPRYERVDSSNQREEWFREYAKTLPKKKDKESDEDKPAEKEEEDDKVKEDREKQERQQASMRERERVVQEEMSVIAKDRDKERESHRYDEAVQHYKALLTDLVRQTDLTYKEARKILKKDSRYELADPLSKHQKEELYEEHLDQLSAKKKQTYRELLEEADVALDASWKEIKRKIREDPRYTKFSSQDSKREKEFDRFVKDKTAKALLEFRDLLKETRHIDFKTKSRIDESEQNMKDIVEILKNDKRFLVLEPLAKARKEILLEYIDDLARRGPPPPPTASEPARRH
ncbi:Transcription elongation regulator 1 [Hypsibius exemplaris]|uniref:Transcription elongation regulator 1 n=1 Tax=Hypsibius exemplaris TaxID=2072580 RepID=A0A1W0WDJ0_HYPEX|nr:Transcription elongation regulator 1 [Hypsibius exemplaris]